MPRKLLTALAACLLVAGCSGGDGNSILSTVPGASTTLPSGTTVPGATTTTVVNGTTTTPDAGTTTSTAPVAILPVPLREGLASFDAYVFTFSVATSGPSADEYIESENRIEYDKASDSRLIVSDTTQNSADTDGPETTSQKWRIVGNVTCTYDGSDWTYSEVSDQEREMSQLAQRLIDFVPVIENPVEVERGEVAGIPAIHYTFSPSGLGQSSGAITEVSTAEYWVSIDGAVLLSYHLVASSRNGPRGDAGTEIFTLEMKADLVDTVGPGEVTLPNKCLEQAP